MENKIKEFIGTDAMSAVEADGVMAWRLVAQSINFKNINWLKESATVCRCHSKDLNFIHEAEKAVIEKTSSGRYGAALDAILFDALCQAKGIESHAIIATASAKQRTAAMLSALSEVEISE